MKTENPPALLPLSNDRMKCLISNSISMMRQRELGVPLWSIVGSLTGHGSGYSCMICKELGLEPGQIVKRNNQPMAERAKGANDQPI